MKKIALTGAVLLLAAVFVSVAGATGQEVCPEGDGWVKVDGLSGFNYTYTPPEGYEVTDNCYKHGTYVHYGTGPSVSADTHKICTWWIFDWCVHWRHFTPELSHASFKLEPLLCEDEGAWNYGEPLPCVYDVCPNLEGLQEEVPEGYVKPGRRCFPKPEPPPTCDDEEALNYGDPLPCEYPELCEDPVALNYGEEGDCEYCQEENPFYLWDDGWCTIRVFAQNWIPTMAYPNQWSQDGYCGCGYFHVDEWGVTYHSNCAEDTTIYDKIVDKPEGCGFMECE